MALFGYIFQKEFLQGITWTGKGANNATRNIALKEKNQVITILTRLCTIADEKYSPGQCEHDIKYVILKYRSRNGKSSKPSNNASRAAEKPASNVTNNEPQPLDGTIEQRLLNQPAVETSLNQVQKQTIGTNPLSERFDAFNYISAYPPNPVHIAPVLHHPTHQYPPIHMQIPQANSHQAYQQHQQSNQVYQQQQQLNQPPPQYPQYQPIMTVQTHSNDSSILPNQLLTQS